MSAQLYSETVTGASSAFKQDTRSSENVVQLHEKLYKYAVSESCQRAGFAYPFIETPVSCCASEKEAACQERA